MLSLGTNIRQSSTEMLQPISPESLFLKIKDRDTPLMALTHELRRFMALDRHAGEEMKKRLPFVCCSAFKNGLRRAEGFLECTGLWLDLDDCITDAGEEKRLRESLFSDPRVCMLFKSPSGKGIKLLFLLETPITNTMEYTSFYKHFATEFGRTYRLDSFVDLQTCDVSRVCFLAHDPDVLFRAAAEKLKVEKTRTEIPPLQFEACTASEKTHGPTEDVYAAIRKKLNPEGIPAKTKQIYVPEEMEYVNTILKQACDVYGFEIKAVSDINYGKKFVFAHGLQVGELNIFYGKKGFQVVQSCKTGLSKSFTETLAAIAGRELYGLNSMNIKWRMMQNGT
jgi:hypothetical protein